MRLIKVDIDNKKTKTRSVTFLDDKDINTNQENFYTVLIGPNGSGKSILLRDIISIFRNLNSYSENSKSQYINFDYTINYCVKNEIVNYTKSNLTENQQINLPKAIIAVSSIINDKFIFDKNDSFYKYAGIRISNNQAGTKTSLKNLINNITRTDYLYIKNIKNVLNELRFDDLFIINYELKQLKTIQALSTYQEFVNYFTKWQDRKNIKRTTEPYSVGYFRKIPPTERKPIYNYLRSIIRNGCNISFNILESNEFEKFKTCYEYIEILTKLDILKAPEILLYKSKTNSVDTAETLSSGEYNMIFHLIRIIINLKDDSLLLIDEPEVSLHPNWQINYIKILEECLKHHKGIHAIIATHSHLLLSGLNPECSSVVAITPELDYELLDYSISGWSPENILYNVFELTSFRNYYFEMDLRKLVQFIENPESRNIQQIQKLISKLEKFNLSENDPLSLLIKDAKEMLN